MRILIADDENMVRLTLKSMLMDLDLNIEKIIEAKNGEEFISLVETFSPDIAFVDIKMPKLTGLKAIELAKKLSPHTQWVILTGFSQFDFAKQALELGVSKYLLKPVSPEELQQTILELIKNSSINNLILNKNFEREIIGIYNQLYSARNINFEDSITKSNFEMGIFYFDGNTQKDKNIKLKKNFFEEITLIAENLIDNNVRIALFNIFNTQIATVCAYDFIKNHEDKLSIDMYYKNVAKLIKVYRDYDFSITIIKCKKFTFYDQIYNKFNEIKKFSSLRILKGISVEHRIDQLKSLDQVEALLKITDLIINLCNYYNEKEILNFNNTLKQINKELTSSIIMQNTSMKNNICEFLKYSMNFELEIGDNLKGWIDALYIHGEHSIQDSEVNNISYIDEVINFISENYMSDIGINIIANNLNLSPNYLSALFHKTTNVKFIDYLTEIRILKSKELLANTNLSIQKISEKVGYHSTRHFTKLFIKYVHSYPSEYKKNLAKI